MYFTKIELNNFGIYKGNNTLYLKNADDLQNITLIGGMNGRGKTTILNAIFIALYGNRSLKVIQDKNINSYPKLLESYINKSAEVKKTSVMLCCQLEDVDNTELTIKRCWELTGTTRIVSETFSIFSNGIKDDNLSKNWNFYVEEIVPLSIARFFFFDNEKISQIADDDSFEQIKESIKQLIGISTIDVLIKDMNTIIRAKKEQGKNILDKTLFEKNNKLQSELKCLSEIIEEKTKKQKEIHAEIKELNNQIEESRDSFWIHGGNLKLSKISLSADQKQKEQDLEEQENNLNSFISNPKTPFALCSDLLKQTFLTVKKENEIQLYRNAQKIIMKLYEDLIQRFKIEHDKSVINQVEYDLSLSIIDEIFAKTMPPTNKSQIDFILSPDSMINLQYLVDYDLNAILQQALDIKRQIQRLKKEIDLLNTRLNNQIDEHHLQEKKRQIKELEDKYSACQVTEKLLVQETKDLLREHKLKSAEQKQIDEEIISFSDNQEKDIRILKYASMTIEVMNEFKLRLQKRKVATLQKNIMSCFRLLIGKEEVISQIQINPITLDITLLDFTKGVLLKNQLSSGEKQMFAISILWGLAITSGYQLPVIIDTPMARLDSIHRKNFVTKYLPNASSQVVVLSTDEEISREYLENIKEHIHTYFTLHFNEENKSTTIENGYFKEL